MSKSATVVLDDETFRIAEQLAERFNKSVPDTIKELLNKERKSTDFKITRGVRKISGILKTEYTYPQLREMYVADHVERYECID